jgi:hypothetical protein
LKTFVDEKKGGRDIVKNQNMDFSFHGKQMSGSILFFFLLLSGSVSGQENSNIVFQVKSFLEHPPTLQTLTFSTPCKEMGDYVATNEESLFTASVQDDSFVLAVLRTPDEVPQMAAKALPIGGKAGSSRWSMFGMTLYLGQTNNTEIDTNDPAITPSETSEDHLDGPLNLGIFHAERGTLKVSENGEFSGPAKKRVLLSWGAESKIEGRFSFSPDGRRLEGATWQVTSKPEITFHTRYFYDDGETRFPPLSWVEWAIRNDGKSLTNHTKILKFEVASSQLPQETFLPDRFMTNINKSDLPPVAPGPIILTRKNGQTLWKQNGKFQVTKIGEPISESSRKWNVWLIRIFIGGFVLVGLVVLIWNAFANAKQHSKK